MPKVRLVEKKHIHRDPRNYALSLRTHTSTHSDDITALHFLNSDNSLPQNTLLSGSADGLLCTSNADEDDEDEAVLHVGNWGCSISQAGWIYGHSEPRIWAGSDMETFSTWSKQVKKRTLTSTLPVSSQPCQLDLENNIDIRLPSVHNHQNTWVTDYLITGQSCPSGDGVTAAFVGSNEFGGQSVT